jgi:predicted RNA-binding Zn-ribbon protein involved in translation (DUF1610 family)
MFATSTFVFSEAAMPKCTGCGAEIEPVAFCPFCGATQAGPAAAPDAPAESVELRGKGSRESGFGREMNTFSCKSCGAKVSYDPSVKALACAYCGSSYVIEQKETAEGERPNRLVAFGFGHEDAEKKFWQWLGKGLFRPRDLTKKSSINDIRGVYMPFWAFDVDADSSWTADAGYHYNEKEPYTEKDAQGRSETKYRDVQKTRWQPANGNRRGRYDDWLVSASKGLDQEWVAKIVPFDLAQAKPYNASYLAGFAAENPSINAPQGQVTAQKELQVKEKDACAKMVPGDTQRNLNVFTRFGNWTYDLTLLPLWIAAYRYKDKVYRFLVNGQTGEVQGSAPFSWLKLIIVILIGLGVIGGAAAAYALLGQR